MYLLKIVYLMNLVELYKRFLNGLIWNWTKFKLIDVKITPSQPFGNDEFKLSKIVICHFVCIIDPKLVHCYFCKYVNICRCVCQMKLVLIFRRQTFFCWFCFQAMWWPYLTELLYWCCCLDTNQNLCSFALIWIN